ncbi:unnamed protein product [Ostreobium quekettii]|uniref:Ankyrin repeat n=1 Tax=Ostreobium quekettii TaxID=121088 RepID=A0A8S1JHT1_9CHLO|nr:unnamed protein product [Ostreobium quekettii]|eukprot:evm.model.scf_542.1 EVM.evm.TU.scf_542.1   scf_542:10034-13559(+)
MRNALLALWLVLAAASPGDIHAGSPAGSAVRRRRAALELGAVEPLAASAKSAASTDVPSQRSIGRRLQAFDRAFTEARENDRDAGSPPAVPEVSLEAIKPVNGSGDGDGEEKRARRRAARGTASALWVAAYRGEGAEVRELIGGGADVDERNHNGTTPLYVAAQNGHRAVAELLLDAGAEVDAESRLGSTPLLAAAHNNHARLVELLLERGASPNSGTKRTGQTALWQAAFLGHIKVVEVLLDNGADPNLPGTLKGATPLYAAVHRGHKDVVLLLIESGASATVPLNNGATPLHMASALTRPDLVEILLRHGADPARVDGRGNTAADVVKIASGGDDDSQVAEILGLLQQARNLGQRPEAGGPVVAPMMAAPAQGNVSAVGSSSRELKVSAAMILVPTIAGVTIVVALLSAVRMRGGFSRSRSFDLDPHVKLNDLLSKGISNRALQLRLGLDGRDGYSSSPNSFCPTRRWDVDESEDSRVAAGVRGRPGGAGRSSHHVRWSKGDSSAFSSPSSSTEDSRTLWDAFVLGTRGGMVGLGQRRGETAGGVARAAIEVGRKTSL